MEECIQRPGRQALEGAVPFNYGATSDAECVASLVDELVGEFASARDINLTAVRRKGLRIACNKLVSNLVIGHRIHPDG